MIQPRAIRGNYLVTEVEIRGLTFGKVSDRIVVTGRNHLTDEICEVLHHNYNINLSDHLFEAQEGNNTKLTVSF